MKTTYEIKDIKSFKELLLGEANVTKNDHQGYEWADSFITQVCMETKELGGFSANIADTVLKSCGRYMKAAYVSEKQAYCIARALYEGGVKEITYNI